MSKKNLTFSVQQIGTSQVVIDSLGFACGFFDTLANAQAAIPQIAINVNRGWVHGWLLKPVFFNNRKQNSQVSKKSYTPRRSNYTPNK